MKSCFPVLVLCLCLVNVGCAVGAKSAAPAPAQQPITGSQSASCTLALIYSCPDAVVGQDYICTPTVTQVAPYPCDNPPFAVQAAIQAKAKSAAANATDNARIVAF
jgi:hypothetical protein